MTGVQTCALPICRYPVSFTAELRSLVKETIERIEAFRRSFSIPPAEYGAKCKACSLRTAGFLIILTFVISLLTNKVELKGNKDKIKTNIRHIFLDTFMAGIINAIAIVINMILVKVVGNITGQVQTRVGSIFAIFENLKYIINNFNVILKENIGLFPTNLLYIFIGITLILALIYDLKTKSVNFLTIKLMCIIIISVVCGFLVSLGTLSSFYTGRLHYCIGTMMGFVLICLIMENEDEIFRRIIELILIMYSIVNIYNCIIVTYEHKLVNEYEKQSAKEIEEYIEKYEKENKKQVENIAIYTDRKSTRLNSSHPLSSRMPSSA